MSDNAHNFPAWVNIVLTNEFDNDPYWEEGIENDCPEAFNAISNIQKRPADIHAYMEYRRIYDRYINDIIDYYGGKAAISAYFEETGQYPPGYMDPPRLKMNKTNLAMVKSGVVPEKPGKYSRVKDDYELIEIAEDLFKTDNKPIDFELASPHGKLKKSLKKGIDKDRARDRKNGLYSSHSDLAAGFDIIAQYYNNKLNSDDTDSDSSIFKASYDELAEMYDREEAEKNAEWHIDDDDAPKMSYQYNRILSADMSRRIQMAKMLSDNGFKPFTKKQRKNMSPSELKVLRTELGVSTLSHKDLKKTKKKHHEYEKEITKRTDSFRSLSQALTRSKQGLANDTDERIFDEILNKRR